MKKNVSLLVLTGLALLGLQSCVSETLKGSDTENNPQGLQEVKFASIKGSATRTTTDGNDWVANDSIGIYMLDNLEINIANNLAENKLFLGTPQALSAVNADFAPAALDQTIYYPGSDVVRFISYYPYKYTGTAVDQINNYLYPINVGVQQDPAAIDFLYSDNATGHAVGGGKVNLNFSHSLSKIIINVRPKAGTDIIINNMTGLINGMPIKANINLNDSTLVNVGANQSFEFLGVGIPDQVTYAGYDTAYQAIIIPHDNTGGEFIQLFSGGFRQFTWEIPAVTFERGKIYTYNLTLAGETVIEFTGSIEEWQPLVVKVDEVSHDPSGKRSRMVVAGGVDTMDVVYVRAGDFVMGNKIEVATSNLLLASPHKVTISKGFHIGQTLVTVAQFAKFLNARGIVSNSNNANGVISDLVPEVTGSVTLATASTTGLSWTSPAWDTNSARKNLPATTVTWYGAIAYARWAGGDLPTEAQWEYAARADLDTSKYYIDGTSNGASMANYAWYNTSATHDVKQKTANDWGLYDMAGNVTEWTRDAITKSADYEFMTNAIDPCGVTGTLRVTRGGHYGSALSEIRITSRYAPSGGVANTGGGSGYGFRIVFK